VILAVHCSSAALAQAPQTESKPANVWGKFKRFVNPRSRATRQQNSREERAVESSSDAELHRIGTTAGWANHGAPSNASPSNRRAIGLSNTIPQNSQRQFPGMVTRQPPSHPQNASVPRIAERPESRWTRRTVPQFHSPPSTDFSGHPGLPRSNSQSFDRHSENHQPSNASLPEPRHTVTQSRVVVLGNNGDEETASDTVPPTAIRSGVVVLSNDPADIATQSYDPRAEVNAWRDLADAGGWEAGTQPSGFGSEKSILKESGISPNTSYSATAAVHDSAVRPTSGFRSGFRFDQTEPGIAETPAALAQTQQAIMNKSAVPAEQQVFAGTSGAVSQTRSEVVGRAIDERQRTSLFFGDRLSTTLFQLFGILCAVMLGLLIPLCGMFLILRRSGVLAFRVELVSGQLARLLAGREVEQPKHQFNPDVQILT